MAMVTVGIVCAAGSHEGRPLANSDNYVVGVDDHLYWRDGDGEHVEPAGGAGALVAACDGLGDGADVAATSTVRVLAKLYRPGTPRQPTRTLLDYVQRAHARLHAKAAQAGPVRMGASLTVGWFLEDRVHWVQVGDTRLYLYRAGRLTRLTPTHTHREFATREGHTVPDEPDTLAQAMVWGSRDLGDDARLHLEPGLDAGSEWLETGDRLVFCTDGLWRAVDDVSIADVLRNVPDPQASAVGLLERARSRGGSDHATVLVARVDQLPARTDPDHGGRRGSGATFL